MFDPANPKEGAYVNVTATHLCNRRCEFCIDEYRGKPGFISLDSIKYKAERIQALGIKHLLITGGEPTLHPQIVDICKLLRSYDDFVISMTTNYSNPAVTLACSDHIDNMNVSNYGQLEGLTKWPYLKCDVTISSLIYKGGPIATRDDLDNFIRRWESWDYHLKFKTLCETNSNKQYVHDTRVDWLDCLPGERIVLFNELVGQWYKGCIIMRYDQIVNKAAKQSLKLHPNGELNDTWFEEFNYEN